MIDRQMDNPMPTPLDFAVSRNFASLSRKFRLACASASMPCFSASIRRTFSIAITASSAKVSRSAIWLSENGRTSHRRTRILQWRSARAATVPRAWCDGPRVLRHCCPTGIRYPLQRDRGHEPSAYRMWLVLSPCRDLWEHPHGLEYPPEFPRMKLSTEEGCSPGGRSPHCSSCTGVRHVRPPHPAPTESANPR
jgi:hypothetical protein